jgi:hypothetical protein
MKEAWTKNIIKNFTDQVGGDPDELANILFSRYVVDDFAYHDDWYYFGVTDYLNKVVIPHKIAVYESGVHLAAQEWFKDYLKLGEEKELFLDNLWTHDLSKFSANEVFGYAMYNRETGHGKEGFEIAWHHHKMNNPHHPEYWFNPNRSGELEPIAMPAIYVLEMIADWMGAGKTYGSTLEQWLPGNLHKFKFGVAKSIVQNILKDIGIKTFIHEGNVLKTVE